MARSKHYRVKGFVTAAGYFALPDGRPLPYLFAGRHAWPRPSEPGEKGAEVEHGVVPASADRHLRRQLEVTAADLAKMQSDTRRLVLLEVTEIPAVDVPSEAEGIEQAKVDAAKDAAAARERRSKAQSELDDLEVEIDNNARSGNRERLAELLRESEILKRLVKGGDDAVSDAETRAKQLVMAEQDREIAEAIAAISIPAPPELVTLAEQAYQHLAEVWRMARAIDGARVAQHGRAVKLCREVGDEKCAVVLMQETPVPSVLSDLREHLWSRCADGWPAIAAGMLEPVDPLTQRNTGTCYEHQEIDRSHQSILRRSADLDTRLLAAGGELPIDFTFEQLESIVAKHRPMTKADVEALKAQVASPEYKAQRERDEAEAIAAIEEIEPGFGERVKAVRASKAKKSNGKTAEAPKL